MAEVATRQRSDRKDAWFLGGAAALVGTGLFLWARRPSRPGVKAPGDPITASIKYSHRGPDQDVLVGFGYARSQAIGHGDITDFTRVADSVDTDPAWEPYSAKVTGEVPELPADKYDLFVFIQASGLPLKKDGSGFLASRWYDDWLTIE